jgi:hypothetical protein
MATAAVLVSPVDMPKSASAASACPAEAALLAAVPETSVSKDGPVHLVDSVGVKTLPTPAFCTREAPQVASVDMDFDGETWLSHDLPTTALTACTPL